MRDELRQHLDEALAEGRSIDSVVGPSPAAFAESWAAEHRELDADRAWEAIIERDPEAEKERRFALISYVLGGIAIVGGVITGAYIRGETSVDDNIWRWVWTFLAVGFGIGEIFTAAFFLLPFAIGAAAASVLAWIGVGLIAQWFVFFGVSLIAFAYLRRFIVAQDALEQPRVGANRWIGLEGMVLQDIDNDEAVGMVRVESEEWRAISDDGTVIGAGTRIKVIDVRGARLVVTRTDH
jgi:membrane protein implicated in regulation of membrane protease activity